MPIGTQLLEIVAPITEGTTAERFLLRRKGAGGYMVITQTDDHPPRRAQVEDLGIRIVGQFDEHGFTNMQLHPADTGGSFLEIDRQEGGEDPMGAWSPAGPNWQQAIRTDRVSAITAAEMQCDDPNKVANRWSEIIEIERADVDGVPTIPLENATLRFVDDRRRPARGPRWHRRRVLAAGGRQGQPPRSAACRSPTTTWCSSGCACYLR